MKVVTLTQPWATLVAIGAKRIETRSWQTHYRGPLAIHAAKGFPAWAREFADYDRACRDELLNPSGRAPSAILPRGAIVGVAQLVGIESTATVRHMIHVHEEMRRNGGLSVLTFNGVAPAEHELAFGDYTPGRYAWLLADVRPLATPIPCRGMLGLWEVSDAILEGVAEAAT